MAGTSDADKAKVQKLFAAHDPTKPGPPAPVSVSGDALVASLTDDQANTIGMRDLARLAARPVVSDGDVLLKRVAGALKTTPGALLAEVAG